LVLLDARGEALRCLTRANEKPRRDAGRGDPGGYLHFYLCQLCPGGPERGYQGRGVVAAGRRKLTGDCLQNYSYCFPTCWRKPLRRCDEGTPGGGDYPDGNGCLPVSVILTHTYLHFYLRAGTQRCCVAFGRDHGVATRDVIPRSVRENRARRRDLAGFVLFASKIPSEAGR
jgi:hypothetical protein